MLLSRPLYSERLTERACGAAWNAAAPNQCRWNDTDHTTIATDGKMLNSFAVLLALCLGQSEVTTSPRSGFASSDNFVVYAPDQELADEVLKKSEELRTKLARAWLGKTLLPGVGATMIHIKLSSSEDSGFTWPKDHPAKKYHSITMTSSRDRVLGTTLAHELTHVMLAIEFGDRLPRWANEGAATCQDGEKLRQTRSERLQRFAKTNEWPALLKILNQQEIGSDEAVFYTVANSLTEFLLERDDSDVFFRFSIAGKETGWELAAKNSYEFHSLQEMEQGWHDWVQRRYANGPKAVSQTRKTASTARQ